MSHDEVRQRARRLRNVPLPSILELLGVQRDRYDRCKWHTRQGVLSVNGAKFFNWNREIGGVGAIDLIMRLESCNFNEALDWLDDRFCDQPSFDAGIEGNVRNSDPNASKLLALPAPVSANLWRVRNYLHRKRRIDLTEIQKLIDAGALYADHRSNAVFPLFGIGDSSIVVGAELRGTTTVSWRGMAPGSQKNQGYFSLPRHGPGEDRRSVILCESAIDAISCSIIYPRCLCLSTAGARANPQWLRVLIDQSRHIYCGYDADEAGDERARAMIACHPTIERLRPARHDWNEVLKSRVSR